MLRTLTFVTCYFLFLVLTNIPSLAQNSVGIGTENPNENAVLELVSPNSDQGLLVPKLTTSQRTAPAFLAGLSSNENGLLVFDSDENQFYYWQDSQWETISNGVNLIAGIGIDISGNTISNIGDADADPQNEIQDLQLAGNILTVTNNVGATPIDLSGLAGMDAQTLAALKTGSDVDISISNGNTVVVNVDDNDADASNEIQNISIAGNTVSIDGGGTGFDLSLVAPGPGEVLKWNGVQWESATDATAAGSTLPVLGDAQIVTNNGANTAVSISGDLNMDNTGNMTIQPNSVSTNEILDGTITDLDIDGAAIISSSKLQTNVMLEGENISLLANDLGFITDLSSFTTDNLVEGASNLYYTDGRVDSRIALTSVTALTDVTNAGSGQIITAGERILLGSALQDLSAQTTDNLLEGASNLYYTNGRVDARIATTSVTALSDVTNAGSGLIITAVERSDISTNSADIATLQATGLGFTQPPNRIYAGPPSGVALDPTFRTLVQADIPGLDASYIISGTLPITRGGTNSASLGGSGTIPYSDGSSYLFSAVGGAGQVLSSNGVGAPTWINDDFGWGLSGNAGITAFDFIGTTDANDLPFRVNSIEEMRIRQGGWVGIGGSGSTDVRLETANTTTVDTDLIRGTLSTSSAAGSASAFQATVNGTAGGTAVAGIYSTVTQDASGSADAHFALVGGSGNGIRSGFNSNVFGGGTNIKYGVRSSVNVTAGSQAYGLYVPDAAGATTNYGLYVESISNEPSFYSGIFMDGNVGIGTPIPSTELDVVGTVRSSGFRLTTAPTPNYVLTSDASGNGSWAPIPSQFSTLNRIPKGNGTILILSSIYDDGAGNVGFGTTSPTAGLHSTSNNGMLIEGNFGSGSIPIEGIGVRTMWYPGKAAFRAGRDSGSGAWDDALTGNFSVGMGQDTQASGTASVALGSGNVSSGNNSFTAGQLNNATGIRSISMGYINNSDSEATVAIGYGNTATGSRSAAIGNGNTASVPNSYAFGWINSSNGDGSMALGYVTNANADNSFTLGSFADANAINSSVIGVGINNVNPLSNGIANSLMVGFNSTVPTLFVGPSAGAGTVGNVGIGTSTPGGNFEVVGSHYVSIRSVNLSSASFPINNSDYIISVTTGNGLGTFTTLPSANAQVGRVLIMRVTESSGVETLTINAGVGDLVEGAASYTIQDVNPGNINGITLVSVGGNNWIITQTSVK